jgi:shikimate kinase
MPNYDLGRMGDEQFEHLIQALLKRVIGLGTTTFGAGPDGGREATFSGAAPYPSSQKGWTGSWIFQAKFHNIQRIGAEKARAAVISDLKSELHKICFKYKKKFDNYILATNVPLSSVDEVGTHDKIAADIIPEFTKHIKNIHVWGYDDLSRFLDVHSDVRQPYLHLITPGDLIAELMDRSLSAKSHLAETIQLYARASSETEQYSQLDQAGEIGEKPIPLRKVFVDLDVKVRNDKDLNVAIHNQPDISPDIVDAIRRERVSACLLLLKVQLPRIVLIGGPGQGKSTLGQFIAQIHRAYLLQKRDQINTDRNLLPTAVRVPFRVILKDYAQRLSEAGAYALETYIAEIVSEKAGRAVTADQIQTVLKDNPCLLILDGLDEVTEETLRANMLQHVSTFVARAETLNANLQIIATSRQNNYSDQFDPTIYVHFALVTMDRKKVLEYTAKWTDAKGLDGAKAQFLKSSIKDCIEDRHFSPLMNTPLQVTIFILIILNGGTPPRQREELFNEYLEVIYKRERAKSKTIIQTEKRLLFGLHQYMGYILHRGAAASQDVRSRMKVDEFSTEVFRYLRKQDPFSDELDLHKAANTLIKEARDRLVLLVELESDYFGFELRSIQEFFAAAYLADTAKNDKQRFERFSSIALPPHWHNVALFFAGRVGRSYPGEAAQILEVSREIDRADLDTFMKRGAWLALDIAVDRSFGPARTLQRSAIEYSLTILDTEIDADGLAEIISRLSQLPKEDLLQLVDPILTNRISKLRPWDDLTTLSVYMGLDGKKEVIESFISTVLTKSPDYAEKLFREAVRFNLPLKFVGDTFVQLLASLSNDELVEALLGPFRSSPQYVAALLRPLSAGKEIALALFERGFVDQWRFISKIPEDLGAIQTAKASDVPGQMAIALQMLSVIRGHDFHWKYSASIQALSSQVRGQLVKFATDSTMTIPFRAMCLAMLVRTQQGIAAETALAIAAEKIKTTLEEKEHERVNYFLFFCGLPTLDVILPLASMSKTKRPVRPIFMKGTRKLSPPNAGLLTVIDPFDIEKTKAIWNEIAGQKLEFKELDLAIWKFRQRLEGFPIRRGTNISLRDFGLVIRAISSSVSGPDEGVWRAWASIMRLDILDIDENSEGREEFIQALNGLLGVLEQRMQILTDRWELGALVILICNIGGTDDQVCRLLRIFKAMPMTIDKEPTAAWGSQITAPLLRLQAIAETSDECFAGFLKIFPALVVARRQHIDLFDEAFKSDIARAIHVAKTQDLPVQRGAIMFLAENANKDLDAVRSLVECSRNGEVGRVWIASLLDRTAHQLRPEEAVAFLHPIFIRMPEYPRSLRLAALRSLRDVTKLLPYDLSEDALGLPFQQL